MMDTNDQLKIQKQKDDYKRIDDNNLKTIIGSKRKHHTGSGVSVMNEDLADELKSFPIMLMIFGQQILLICSITHVPTKDINIF